MSDSLPPQNSTDFTPERVATAVSKHDEELILVKNRLDELEKRFGSNEKIADTLCETDEKASKFPEMLSKRFIKLLGDEDVKKPIRLMISEQLNKNWKAFALSTGGKIAFLAWSLLTIWLGHIWK